MNPKIPLDVFIPPQPEFDYVNLLVTNDRHGLNSRVFLIRVNDWSVKKLSGVIAFHNFRSTVELKYSEQSALEEMISDVRIAFVGGEGEEGVGGFRGEEVKSTNTT